VNNAGPAAELCHSCGALLAWSASKRHTGPARTDNRPTIGNPGIVVVIGEEEVVSKPEFERVDFVVTR